MIEHSEFRALLAGKAKLGLPGTVGMDDFPIAFCDVLGIEGGARNDLPGDRQCRHADAIRLQIGSEHGGGGSERCFAEGNGRQGGDGMICETAPCHQDGAGAGRPHNWGSDLCHHDGADDINRIGGLQVRDARAQELVGALMTAL